VQTPVFLVLYNVLRGLTLRVPTMGSNGGHVVGQHLAGVPVTKPPHIVHNFEPQYLPLDSELYRTLHGVTEMRSLGLDLATSASDVFSTNIISSIPYLLLIGLVAITGLVQQRQIQSRNSGATINPQQQAIMKIMPFFLPVFSFALPSGLVLYFVVSNTYRVGQQWFISRNIYGKGEAAAGGPSLDKASDDPGPTGPTRGGLQGFLDQLLGRDGATAAEKATDAPARPANERGGRKSGGDNSRRPAKTPAKAANKASTKAAGRPAAKGGRTTGGQQGSRAGGKSTAGKSTAAKTPTGGSASQRNGRNRNAAAGDEKAATRTSNAPGSSGRVASTKKQASTPEPGPSTTRPPTLQPRARKNKKR
jgi:membrane protein insertase Oxa1/YidC/SpoIIIJ